MSPYPLTRNNRLENVKVSKIYFAGKVSRDAILWSVQITYVYAAH